MDRGPWVIHKSATGVWHVCSDDLTHDVTLEITGDFWTCEEKKYAEWLANELNDCAALRAEVERLKEWGVAQDRALSASYDLEDRLRKALERAKDVEGMAKIATRAMIRTGNAVGYVGLGEEVAAAVSRWIREDRAALKKLEEGEE